jgi:hypothetical protein
LCPDPMLLPRRLDPELLLEPFLASFCSLQPCSSCRCRWSLLPWPRVPHGRCLLPSADASTLGKRTGGLTVPSCLCSLGRMTWDEPFSCAQQEPCPASAGLSSRCLCRKHRAVDTLGSVSPEAAIFVTFFSLHLVELPSVRPCCVLQAFLSELSLGCGSFMGFPPSCEGPPLLGLEPPSHGRSIWRKP